LLFPCELCGCVGVTLLDCTNTKHHSPVPNWIPSPNTKWIGSISDFKTMVTASDVLHPLTRKMLSSLCDRLPSWDTPTSSWISLVALRCCWFCVGTKWQPLSTIPCGLMLTSLVRNNLVILKLILEHWVYWGLVQLYQPCYYSITCNNSAGDLWWYCIQSHQMFQVSESPNCSRIPSFINSVTVQCDKYHQRPTHLWWYL